MPLLTTADRLPSGVQGVSRAAHSNPLSTALRTNQTNRYPSSTPIAAAVCRPINPMQKPITASATATRIPRPPIEMVSASFTTGTSYQRARPTAMPIIKAAQTALARALRVTTVISLEANTGPRRGMKLSQLAIDPVLYSAPMKLPATINAASATR